jgi:uncharacterized membrane protein
MRVRFGGTWIADSEDVLLLHDIGDAQRAAWSYREAYPKVGRIADLGSFERHAHHQVAPATRGGAMIRFDPWPRRHHPDRIRWFRSAATTSPPDDPAGSGRGFGTERDPARLVFFSDAVFAIAVTLLVLEIRPPQDTRHLVHGLAALWPSYLSYTITFLLIGQVWANHHVMFDHIRVADRTVLFLNTLLLMDIAFLPFAASVLAGAFRAGQGQRSAVVFYGMAFELAAILFNVIWDYTRHGRRLLGTTIDAAGASAVSRRFRLALAWIATGTLLGALLPVLGVAVVAAFIPYYWLPIRGETASEKPQHHGRRQA